MFFFHISSGHLQHLLDIGSGNRTSVPLWVFTVSRPLSESVYRVDECNDALGRLLFGESVVVFENIREKGLRVGCAYSFGGNRAAPIACGQEVRGRMDQSAGTKSGASKVEFDVVSTERLLQLL